MRLLILLTTFLFISKMADAQFNALQFANIEKYKEKNIDLSSSNSFPDVVFYGNSITEAWVNDMPDFFNKNNFIGRGISGQTSSQLLLRFRDDVIGLRPKVVIINIGTNDIAENTGPYSQKFTLDNIASMIEIALSNSIKVIIASVLPSTNLFWNSKVTDEANKIIALNEGLKSLASKYQLRYIDYHDVLKNKENGLDKNYAYDEVHPTLEAYKIMANLALKTINSILE